MHLSIMSRNIRSIKYRLLAFPLFFGSVDVSADESIRCNGSLIDIGELVSTVLHKCGQPTDTVEYTVYSALHQRFIVNSQTQKRVLTFKNGILWKMDFREYGY